MKHHKMSSQTSVFQNEDNKEEELIYFLSNLFSALNKIEQTFLLSNINYI